MPIDLATEETALLTKSGRFFPNPQPKRTTLWRYALKGCRGVILETMIAGGSRRVTSREAVGRFLAALNAPREVILPENPRPTLTALQRRKQAEAADRVLKEAGL